jgi:hypothetical protein
MRISARHRRCRLLHGLLVVLLRSLLLRLLNGCERLRALGRGESVSMIIVLIAEMNEFQTA